ncbi:hypothetical protein F4820DRAFT_6101 [Hypoxylon rubiginosum]|uniref:Uncharacterized protein n=1 Tax=Hypoxylon rubiginosum TaxID=110542 RepID=A0ACB9ZJ60_9PEZI|nr:hypothetical protein F4820DRAFT_6101 [Hypoxylon rubiginosum]
MVSRWIITCTNHDTGYPLHRMVYDLRPTRNSLLCLGHLPFFTFYLALIGVATWMIPRSAFDFFFRPCDGLHLFLLVIVCVSRENRRATSRRMGNDQIKKGKKLPKGAYGLARISSGTKGEFASR